MNYSGARTHIDSAVRIEKLRKELFSNGGNAKQIMEGESWREGCSNDKLWTHYMTEANKCFKLAEQYALKNQ